MCKRQSLRACESSENCSSFPLQTCRPQAQFRRFLLLLGEGKVKESWLKKITFQSLCLTETKMSFYFKNIRRWWWSSGRHLLTAIYTPTNTISGLMAENKKKRQKVERCHMPTPSHLHPLTATIAMSMSHCGQLYISTNFNTCKSYIQKCTGDTAKTFYICISGAAHYIRFLFDFNGTMHTIDLLYSYSDSWPLFACLKKPCLQFIDTF